jgi:hypothetical protein
MGTNQGLSLSLFRKLFQRHKRIDRFHEKKNWQRFDGYLCFQSF